VNKGEAVTEESSRKGSFMSYMQTIVYWFTHNPLSATAVFFGGAVVAVTLYTLVYDYRALTNQD